MARKRRHSVSVAVVRVWLAKRLTLRPEQPSSCSMPGASDADRTSRSKRRPRNASGFRQARVVGPGVARTLHDGTRQKTLKVLTLVAFYGSGGRGRSENPSCLRKQGLSKERRCTSRTRTPRCDPKCALPWPPRKPVFHGAESDPQRPGLITIPSMRYPSRTAVGSQARPHHMPVVFAPVQCRSPATIRLRPSSYCRTYHRRPNLVRRPSPEGYAPHSLTRANQRSRQILPRMSSSLSSLHQETCAGTSAQHSGLYMLGSTCWARNRAASSRHGASHHRSGRTRARDSDHCRFAPCRSAAGRRAWTER